MIKKYFVKETILKKKSDKTLLEIFILILISYKNKDKNLINNTLINKK